jgi:16S rRNA (uracil1498-N3)-methyltransferase
MTVHDFNAQRLFLHSPLAEGGEIAATREQANYLRNVLRLGDGERMLVFNGRDGEWRTRLSLKGKRDCILNIEAQTRTQTPPRQLAYLFAPLKRARLDYMVQKAVELGAGRLSPVTTRRTLAGRVNLERMRANAIEAAEQCGILSLPEIDAPAKLEAKLAAWPEGVPLIFCDEGAPLANPIAALSNLKKDWLPDAPLGVLIGPEGGFDDAERAMVMRQPHVTPISLGPRIMRADTAAIAALALVNATVGDWQ